MIEILSDIYVVGDPANVSEIILFNLLFLSFQSVSDSYSS